MTTEELIEYEKNFKEAHKTPALKFIRKTVQTAAGVRTSNRKAVGGIPWIDYYRAFVDPATEKLNCACCGVDISTNSDIVKSSEDIKDAFGGHVLFIGKSSGYYIVPLCPTCNHDSKDIVTLLRGAVAVEEVDAIVE